MRLALASAIPLLLIVLAMVLSPLLDAEFRRANDRKAAALRALTAMAASKEGDRCR